MFRFLLLFALVLSLTACASPSGSDDHATLRNTVYSSGAEAFASMVEDENVLVQCPRFMQSINAAEDIVKDTSRNYPHML